MKGALWTLLLLLTAALVAARLGGFRLSWVWVLAPLWVPVALTLLLQTVRGGGSRSRGRG